MIALLYAVFVLSGVAGLIYETIWTRYLGLFVGHSAYAQVIVLVIFLGGMSLGALAVGRWSERVSRPLFVYGLVEMATGAIGIVFHNVFVAATNAAYDHVFPAIGIGAIQTIVKWSIAGALILPQSILLGATFPMMSAAVVRRIPARSGRALSMLYFANSLGGALGVLLAGFVFVQWSGLPGTLMIAAVVNLFVAAVAVSISYAAEDGSSAIARHAAGSESEASDLAVGSRGWLWRLMLAVSFGTALSSFIYEIAWIRMLALVLGSATHSFELMLSAFILGLALGAYWIRGRADAFERPVLTLGLVQIAMGSLAIATLPVYVRTFYWMADLLAAFAKTEQGYALYSVSRYILCLCVMLPATFCAGMTLPLITRTLLGAGVGERAIGQVYGVNTLGAIVGAGLAGLVLLPVLGLKWLLIAGALIDIGLGLFILGAQLRARRASIGVGGRELAFAVLGGALLAVLVRAAPFRLSVLTSGVFRYESAEAGADSDVVFYHDGRTATVSVRRTTDEDVGFTLATNGKPDASLGLDWISPDSQSVGAFTFDASTQTLIPVIALAYQPQAREVAVIGHGSGVTSHTVLGDPAVRHAVTIEIEPDMIRGARFFYPANRRVFDDPRSVVVVDDARSYFATRRAPFDLIISEPSNPWVSGVSGLFTTEFYRGIRAHLSPHGVFAQWLHLYEIDDRLVESVIAALAQQLPAYTIYQTSDHDVLIVAGASGLPSPDWSVTRLPGVAADLRHVWAITPGAFEALHVVDAAALAPVLRGVHPNSDFYPTLDLNAERARYLGTSANGFALINADRVNVPALVAGTRERVGEVWDVVPEAPRLHAAAMSTALRERGRVELGSEASSAAAQEKAFFDGLADGRAPSSWMAWTQQFTAVEALVQGATTGSVDPGFYARVVQYLDRTRAPTEVRAVVGFTHGIAAWDFGEAVRQGDVLFPAVLSGTGWIDPDMLRDGLVLAKLKLGDRVGAGAVLKALAHRSARDESDLRSQLLSAYVADTTDALFRP